MSNMHASFELNSPKADLVHQTAFLDLNTRSNSQIQLSRYSLVNLNNGTCSSNNTGMITDCKNQSNNIIEPGHTAAYQHTCLTTSQVSFASQSTTQHYENMNHQTRFNNKPTNTRRNPITLSRGRSHLDRYVPSRNGNSQTTSQPPICEPQTAFTLLDGSTARFLCVHDLVMIIVEDELEITGAAFVDPTLHGKLAKVLKIHDDEVKVELLEKSKKEQHTSLKENQTPSSSLHTKNLDGSVARVGQPFRFPTLLGGEHKHYRQVTRRQQHNGMKRVTSDAALSKFKWEAQSKVVCLPKFCLSLPAEVLQKRIATLTKTGCDCKDSSKDREDDNENRSESSTDEDENDPTTTNQTQEFETDSSRQQSQHHCSVTQIHQLSTNLPIFAGV